MELMADDSGGILSEIADVVGDVAGEAVDELAKFGQTATSQISGHAGGTGQGTKADVSKIKNATTGAVSDQTAVDEVKGFGKSFLGQITGHMDAVGADIAKMAKADNKFSEVESAKVKAKINQIYQEYTAKRAREQQQQQVQEQKEEQGKAKAVQLQSEKKQEDMDVAVAQAKSKAEIKNYGAE